MSCSKSPVFRFAPIFRLAIPVSVRRDDATFNHHRIDVEVIIFTNSKKPDVLRAVLPVRLGPTPFLAFPCDSVLRNEIFFTDALDCCGTAPVATDVTRRCGLEGSDAQRQPLMEPLCIVFGRDFL